MATPPKTAAQYVAEATANQQGGVQVAKPAPLKAPKAVPFAGGSKTGPQDPVTWLMDILSRPLYAVTDTLKGQIDAPAAAKKVLDAGGSPLAAMGASLQTNLQHNPITGFFSTDKANKSTTSDLIEHGTDTIGAEVNPQYKDTQNNVNPVLKGILGFAGDVALDPTTYIPGAAFVKGFTATKEAIKGAKGAADTAIAAKAAKAGDKAVADLSTDTPITPENAVDSGLSKATPVPELTPAQQLTGFKQATEKKAILAIGNPKHADIKTALASLKPFAKPAMKAVTDPAAAKPLEFQAWLKGASEDITKGLQDPKLKDLPYEKAAVAFGKVSVGGEKIPFPTAVGRALAGDTVALEDLGHVYRQSYLPKQAKGAATGTLISPLGKAIKPVSAPVVDAAKLSELQAKADADLSDVSKFQDAMQTPEAPSGQLDSTGSPMSNQEWVNEEIRLANEADGVADHTPQSVLDWMISQSDESQSALDAASAAAHPGAQTVLSALQASKSNARGDEAFVRGALGNKLVDNLHEYTNPDSFDKAVSELSSIMNGSLNITEMKTLGSPSRKLLERLGFQSPETIPAEMKRLQDAAGVVPLPKKDKSFTEELMKRINVDDIPQEQVDGAAKALDDFTLKDILNPRDPVKYPYTTQVAGAARTSDTMGEGVGRLLDEVNTFAQGDIATSLMKTTIKLVKDSGARPGVGFAVAKSEIYRRMLRLAERGADVQGLPMTIGVGEGRILLGGSQILDVLADVDAKALATTYFNFNTAAITTNLYDAVYAAVKGGDRASIEAALTNMVTRYGKEFDANNLVNPITKVEKGRKYMFGTRILTSEQLVKMLSDTIEKATPRLQKVVEQNAEAHAARGLSETMKMTDDQLNLLETMYQTEGSFGPLLSGINDVGTRVLEEAATMGAMAESTFKAGAIIDASIPPADMAAAVAATKMGKATESLGVKMTPRQALDEMQKVGNLIAQEKYEKTILAEANMSGQTLDIGEITQSNQATGMFAMFAPLSRVFGNKLLHQAFRDNVDVARGITSHARDEIAKIDKRFTRDVKQQAFYDLQNGTVSSNEAVRAAADAYRPLTQQLFGGVKDFTFKDSAFFREGTSVHHLNSVLESKGMGDYVVDVEAAARTAKEQHISIIDAMAAQWMKHDVKDTSEYLNGMFTVLTEVNAHHVLSMDFMAKAKQYGGISHVPKEGYVRLVNDSGKSILAAYLPKDVYFQKDIASQLGVVDSLLRETLDLGGPIGKFVREVYKPALDMWKTGMTILNPAHHVRNALSDMDLTRSAEGFTTRPIYKWAMEAIATRNQYDRFDAIAALNGIHASPKPGRVLFKGKLAPNGITPADLYQNAADRGALPNYKRLENLDENTQGFLGRIETSIQNTKPVRAAASISEANSHWTRLAHMAQFVEKNIDNTKDYKSLEDLWQAASNQVKKWHPDGSDLGQFDQLARLVIPFYSWQRKSIPLVLETYLTHPARAQVIPKASYNLAVSMGVNPDSLSDPFPDDQMFPSYLTEKTLGPQFKVGGKYYGINPGFASTGTLDTYLGNNPLQSILGQVAPGIRAPFELASGANVGTGSKINDTSDYIDSQIPLVAPLSRLTGNSVTGSALSLLQGKGLDPQYQIARGNKDPSQSSLAALLNYLSGAGLTPMSQPNQINYAEIEKRNAAAQTKGN